MSLKAEKSVYITKDLHKALKMRASEKGISIVELAEDYLRAMLKQDNMPTR